MSWRVCHVLQRARAHRCDARMQGYLVGNPTTSRAGVYDSEPHFALYKALIGRPLFEELVAACDNVFHNITPGACRMQGWCSCWAPTPPG